MIADVMKRGPRTIAEDALAVEAVQIMEKFKVNGLLASIRQDNSAVHSTCMTFSAREWYERERHSGTCAWRAHDRVRRGWVLTDGSLFYGDDGQEYKAFNSRDGHGIKMLRASGVETAIITGRTSQVVLFRARNLASCICSRAPTTSWMPSDDCSQCQSRP